MTEFQEKLRQQHEESMHRELEALVQTAGPGQAEVSGPTRNMVLEEEEEYVESSGGCHNMLLLVACREQIFDEAVLSCTEVTVRTDRRPATLRTRTHHIQKRGVIVEVFFTTVFI